MTLKNTPLCAACHGSERSVFLQVRMLLSEEMDMGIPAGNLISGATKIPNGFIHGITDETHLSRGELTGAKKETEF